MKLVCKIVQFTCFLTLNFKLFPKQHPCFLACLKITERVEDVAKKCVLGML